MGDLNPSGEADGAGRHDSRAGQNRQGAARHTRHGGVAKLPIACAMALAAVSTPASADIVVPRDFPTIQAAVDAAAAGSTIRVAPGTYVEQVSIGKDLKLVGSGMGASVIRAPGSLVPGQDGDTAIVEIHSGASVAISRMTVSGPGSGTCEDGALTHGVLLSDGHLDMSFTAVVDIHDSPLSDCPRSGNGVIAFFSSANIHHSFVRNYQAAGIVIVGGAGTIAHNVVTGPGSTPATATGGIELVGGATGTVSYNVVSGNQCGSPDLGCGPDFFNEFQVAGVTGGAPGTVITRNLLFDNQVGIYVGESAELSQNVLVSNDYFALALQDGAFTSRKDVIIGGGGGVAVIAAFADTTATLDHIKIAGTPGAPVQKFECCGFTATVVGGP